LKKTFHNFYIIPTHITTTMTSRTVKTVALGALVFAFILGTAGGLARFAVWDKRQRTEPTQGEALALGFGVVNSALLAAIIAKQTR
jgi:hypothetical protein